MAPHGHDMQAEALVELAKVFALLHERPGSGRRQSREGDSRQSMHASYFAEAMPRSADDDGF